MAINNTCSYCGEKAGYELIDTDDGTAEPICNDCIERLKRMLGPGRVVDITTTDKEGQRN
jgi:hypothetical protein